VPLSTLEDLSHLPIRELRTSDLELNIDECQTLGEWIALFTRIGLKRLYVDGFMAVHRGRAYGHGFMYRLREHFVTLDFPKLMKTISTLGTGVDIVFHTGILRQVDELQIDAELRIDYGDADPPTDDHVGRLVDVLSHVRLKGLIIDHGHTADQLKMLVKFPVRKLVVRGCIDLELSSRETMRRNAKRYIETLGLFQQPCEVDMGYNPNDFVVDYRFTAEDISKMLDLNINISYLSTFMLDIEGTESLEKFLPVLNRMDLKELVWDWNDHQFFKKDHISKEKFRHLPLRYNMIGKCSLPARSVSKIIKEKRIKFHSVRRMTGVRNIYGAYSSTWNDSDSNLHLNTDVDSASESDSEPESISDSD